MALPKKKKNVVGRNLAIKFPKFIMDALDAPVRRYMNR